MSLQGGQHGERMQQPEAPKMSATLLETRTEVEELVSHFGRNLLTEPKVFKSGSGSWREELVSKLDDKEVVAVKVTEGSTAVGFMLIEKSGEIVQLRTLEGREADAGSIAASAKTLLRDKDIPSLSLRFGEFDGSDELYRALEQGHFEKRDEEAGSEKSDGRRRMVLNG